MLSSSSQTAIFNQPHLLSMFYGQSGVSFPVHIRNLEPNTKYVLVTELARASNGNLVNQFQPINTSVTSDEDGTIKTDIPFKANLGVFGGQTLVVFQTLYDEKETKVIADHRDRTDMNPFLLIHVRINLLS